MAQIESIPRFRGDGSEDADKWFQNFVLATGHFNEPGVFRILSALLENGSPAREWYDGLDENPKTSWSRFERIFRSRWVLNVLPPPPDAGALLPAIPVIAEVPEPFKVPSEWRGPTSILRETTSILAETPEPFKVPSEWRKSTTILKKSEIVAMAKRTSNHILLSPVKRDIHDKTIDGSILPPQQCESFLVGLVLHDRLTSGMVHRDTVIDLLSTVRLDSSSSSNGLIGYSYNQESLGFRGLAMIYGYRAYQHPRLIAGALSRWDNLERRTLSENVAGAGFVTQSPGSKSIDLMETVLRMTLSANLADLTKYDKYTAAAFYAANSIANIMVDPVTMLIKNGSISDGKYNGETNFAGLSCCLTGIFIEGLSVFASVTRNEGWSNLVIKVATAAMTTSKWHGSDGILTIGSDDDISENVNQRAFKGVLLRGLVEAYQRNPLNTDFRSLVRSYVNVQFNALRELAANGDTYGVDWRGPYKGPFLHAQLAAVDVINAAIGVTDS